MLHSTNTTVNTRKMIYQGLESHTSTTTNGAGWGETLPPTTMKHAHTQPIHRSNRDKPTRGSRIPATCKGCQPQRQSRITRVCPIYSPRSVDHLSLRMYVGTWQVVMMIRVPARLAVQTVNVRKIYIVLYKQYARTNAHACVAIPFLERKASRQTNQQYR